MALTSSLDTASSLRGVEGRAISTRNSLLRRIKTALPVFPFLIYVALGLGVPTWIITNLAFRTRSGQLTMHNIKLITTNGQYLFGFETSLKLALVTSIIPGVVGTALAYAVAQSEHESFKRILAAAAGVLANFGGVNLAFMFIAAFGPAGLADAWLAHIHLNPWNYGFDIYKFTGVAFVYMYFQVPLMMLVITPALNGLRPQWREAAANLGASKWQYWRHAGLPV